MTIGEFKKLEYFDWQDIEDVFLDLLKKKRIDFTKLNERYVEYLHWKDYVAQSNREEAAICLLQLLNGNFNGDNLKNVQKRAIHTYNKTTTLPKHILDEQYGFTQKDEDYWSKFVENTYGTDE